MDVALRIPSMIREAFLDWAERQEANYEFDGMRPVLMTGGTNDHDLICQNLWFALRTRLLAAGLRSGGPNAGLATLGEAVRYPDAYVAPADAEGSAKLIPGMIVVFEVLSPSSGRVDRIDKVREYAAVPSILRYVLVEGTTAALTNFHRPSGTSPWTATTHTAEDVLRLPEIGIELPVTELFQGVVVQPPEAA